MNGCTLSCKMRSAILSGIKDRGVFNDTPPRQSNERVAGTSGGTNLVSQVTGWRAVKVLLFLAAGDGPDLLEKRLSDDRTLLELSRSWEATDE